MAYNVIFTLTSAGSDSGPFNISGTTSSNTTILIASNVSKSTLQAGYEVTISDDNVTGGTVASVGVCTNTQPWVKPTSGVGGVGVCYSLTYNSLTQTPPNSLFVRYRDITTNNVLTRQINTMQGMDNGDNTTTIYICVSQTGSYSTPTCVENSVEISCPSPYNWVSGGLCYSEADCQLGNQSPQYCYVDTNGVQQGPYNTIQECNQAAGGRMCSQCVS